MKIIHLEAIRSDAHVASAAVLEGWPGAEVVHCVNCEEVEITMGLAPSAQIIICSTESDENAWLGALNTLKRRCPTVPVILLSSTVEPTAVVAAMRAGAIDWVRKGDDAGLILAIGRALAVGRDSIGGRKTDGELAADVYLSERAVDPAIFEDSAGKISRWNRAAEQVLGWSAAEAEGKPLAYFLPNDGTDPSSTSVWATVQEDEWKGEVSFRAKGGKLVTLDVRRYLVAGPTGTSVGQLIVGRDLTERRAIEEQLLRAQRMQSVNLLAAGLAHDLNNVLTPINLALQLLKDDLKDPAQIRTIATLETSVSRGAGLIRQLLSFMHGPGEHGKVLAIAEAFREVGTILRKTFVSEIELTEEVPDGLWKVRMVETHLHQNLMNLAVNARDAMPDGGTLKFSAKNVTLGFEDAQLIRRGRPGKYVMISVADTGAGIPQEVHDRIWEPFFTTKPDGHGTGLGLSSVRGILSRYRGFVDMDSIVGTGTCFRVYLPATIGSPETIIEATSQPHGTGVLVIEESFEVRQLVASVLTKAGYAVVAVEDGIEGAAVFQRRPDVFAVVVSDLNTPGLCGKRLIAVLGKMRLGVRHIFTGSGDAWEGDLKGQYLPKPFQPAELLAAVMNARGAKSKESAGVTE
jgi:PAS domain S-box-containing protein